MARRQVGGVWWDLLRISPAWRREHGYVNIRCYRCARKIGPEEPDAVYVEAEARVEDDGSPGVLESVFQGFFFCCRDHAREFGFVGTWRDHLEEPARDA